MSIYDIIVTMTIKLRDLLNVKNSVLNPIFLEILLCNITVNGINTSNSSKVIIIIMVYNIYIAHS